MARTRSDLVRELEALSLERGATVMVHAGLRKVGPVEGGAATVLAALRDVIGEGGTIVMNLGSCDDTLPWDALAVPADPSVGVLAEVFRTAQGTRVSDHPAARFGASGPAAAAILEPVPLNDYYGPGSALERLFARDGWVLRLGADIDTITLAHYAEYLARLPHKHRVVRPYVARDGTPLAIASLDDSDGIVAFTGGDYFAAIARDFLGRDEVRRGRVGEAPAELFAARGFVRFAVAWLEARQAEGALSPRT